MSPQNKNSSFKENRNQPESIQGLVQTNHLSPKARGNDLQNGPNDFEREEIQIDA